MTQYMTPDHAKTKQCIHPGGAKCVADGCMAWVNQMEEKTEKKNIEFQCDEADIKIGTIQMGGLQPFLRVRGVQKGKIPADGWNVGHLSVHQNFMVTGAISRTVLAETGFGCCALVPYAKDQAPA